jgi:hypothetical protein
VSPLLLKLSLYKLTLAKKGIKELYVALQDEEYAENTSLQWR